VRQSIKDCVLSHMSKTTPEKERLLTAILNELCIKIEYYMHIHKGVDWSDVLDHIQRASDTTNLDRKHAESNLVVTKWNNVRKSRSKRTLTDIKYEEINARINELELIMTDIYGIQDTKAPQADLRTLLRCLQTASVDG
jgi:hypothetical protein